MDENPYGTPRDDSLNATRRPERPVLKIVYVALACLTGIAATYSLWGAIYFHWESSRQLPQAEIESASLASHEWFFWMVVCTVACGWFSILAARTLARN